MWHSLRLEGTVYAADEARQIRLVVGAESLPMLLDRLWERLIRGMEATEGWAPDDLIASAHLSLTLNQWTSFNAFKRCEQALGQVHPKTTTRGSHAPGSGSCLPGEPPPAIGPGSSRM